MCLWRLLLKSAQRPERSRQIKLHNVVFQKIFKNRAVQHLKLNTLIRNFADISYQNFIPMSLHSTNK